VFNTGDAEWNRVAQRAWRGWAKRCDFRGTGLTWSDSIGLGLISILRDGDYLTVWDELLLDGLCLWYEADQLAEIAEGDWAANAPAAGLVELDPVTGKPLLYTQASGVVRDRFGRVRGWVATSEYGQQQVPWSKATVWRPEQARLTMKPYRFNQVRGNSALIAMVSAISDVRSMVLSEIQSGKRASQEALAVKQKRPPLLGNGLTELAGTTAGEQRYEQLEESYGGAVVYMGLEDDLKVVGNDRPATQVRQFAEWVAETAGKSLGLFPVFASGKITNPANARLEVLLTWAAFRVWQKMLERGPVDFVVPRVVRHLVRRGELPACPVAPEESYQVEWPAMPLLTPKDEIEAAVARIKAGGSDFATEFGPSWPETVRKLAEQKDLLTQELGLEFISVFETVSGTNLNQKTQKVAAGADGSSQGAQP
jgi:capsid protein